MGLESSVDAAAAQRPRPYRHEARLGIILGLRRLSRRPYDHHDHDHHDHGDHAHAIDPHVWLDPI
ncbi:MAG: hypothetical protein KF705_06820 [Phycisphaeraceae bacterium]|nr:hypothetical protein [Phycisphaeraceae bacterium]